MLPEACAKCYGPIGPRPGRFICDICAEVELLKWKKEMGMYTEDSDAYPLDSPKHPTYGERMADWADTMRKRMKEDMHRAEWEATDNDPED